MNVSVRTSSADNGQREKDYEEEQENLDYGSDVFEPGEDGVG